MINRDGMVGAASQTAPTNLLEPPLQKVYLVVFGNATYEEEEVSLEGQVVPKKDTFCYLGSMLQKDGDTDIDV